MDPQSRKLRHETQQETEHAQQTSAEQQHTMREFGSVEELLRHDAEQIVVPPHIAASVRESIAREPGAPRGWWQRLFGR